MAPRFKMVFLFGPVFAQISKMSWSLTWERPVTPFIATTATTKDFTVLELQNSSLDVSILHKICQWTDFEPQNFRNISSGVVFLMACQLQVCPFHACTATIFQNPAKPDGPFYYFKPSKSVDYIERKRQSTALEALKLRRGRSGKKRSRELFLLLSSPGIKKSCLFLKLERRTKDRRRTVVLFLSLQRLLGQLKAVFRAQMLAFCFCSTPG